MGGKGRAAAGAIGDDLKALVQKALVPNLLEGPPLALDEVVVIGDVGVLHVGPEAHVLGEILPQALVLPHALLALLNEGGNAIGLDLLLAVDVQQLFHFQLHGQAVGIPAGLAGDHLPLHGVEPGEQVLKGPGLQVADVGLAVGGGGAVVEDIGVVALALLHALFEDVVFFPEFFRFLLPLHKIQVGGDFLVHAHGSHPFSGLCSPELTEKIKKPRPAQTGRRLGFAYTTHSGISNNTRPGNGGVPAALTGGFAGKPCWARGSGGMRLRLFAPACTNRRLSAAEGTLRLSPSWPLLSFFVPHSTTWAGESQENAGRKPGPRPGRKGAFFTKNLLDTPAACCAILYLSG